MNNKEIYKGYTIKWETDDDVTSPRKDQENLGMMCCWHRRLLLGDKQPKESASDYLADLARGDIEFDEAEVLLDKLCGEGSAEDIERARVRYMAARTSALHRVTVFLPLYLYEHSGLTMATTPFSCQWDSGQVGFIYATLAMCKHYFGKAQVPKGVTFDTFVPDWDSTKPPLPLRELVLRVLRQEVQTYDDYLTGNVRYYKVTDPDGEEIFSRGGYYPSRDESGHESWDYVLADCRSEVDADIESKVAV